MFWLELAPQGLGCGFSKIVFLSVTLRPSTGWVGRGQAKQGVVNEMWERGEIVMCITVPDTCILAESNQVIKYSSPSNSQTQALNQKPNGFVLFVMQHKLVGHFWWEWPVKHKMFILQGLLHP